jgi:hypothetical protein
VLRRVEIPIPEVIFDPTLVLSPHMCLLGMLFKLVAFKSPNATCAEKLYSLKILKGLNQQDMPIKDHFLDKFVFSDVTKEADGFHIALDQPLNKSFISYRLERASQITGFKHHVRVSDIRPLTAKSLNDSRKYRQPVSIYMYSSLIEQFSKIAYVTAQLQNAILQHANIETFVAHYSVGVHVDVQGIVRGLQPQNEIVRFASSRTCSIDRRRPWKLTYEQSQSVNEMPEICALTKRVAKHSEARKDYEMKWECEPEKYRLQFDEKSKRYQQSLTKLRDKRRELRTLLRQNILKRYNDEQPVIDSERQLSGMIVEEEVDEEANKIGHMAPDHLQLVNAVLTLPPTATEEEYRRRITATNMVTLYCGVQEAVVSKWTFKKKRTASDAELPPQAKQQEVMPDKLSQRFASLRLDEPAKRTRACFLCGETFATPGSLSRHLRRRHINPPWPEGGVRCDACSKILADRMDMLRHAEQFHGTVSRVPLQHTEPISKVDRMDMPRHAKQFHGTVSRVPLQHTNAIPCAEINLVFHKPFPCK